MLRAATRELLKFYERYFPINKGKWFVKDLLTPFITKNKDCFKTTMMKKGFLMRLNLYEATQKHMYYFGEWEPNTTKLIENILKPGDVFVDIGANVGYYTLLCSKITGNRGKVYSIEACRKTYNLLGNNVKLNKMKNVVTANFAVSDKAGKSKFYHARAYFDPLNPNMYGNNQGSNSLFYENVYPEKGKYVHLYRKSSKNKSISGESYEVVKTKTFDSYADEIKIKNISLVKIDVEGAEYKLLKGMKKTLKKFPDIKLIMELHDPLLKHANSSQKQVIDFLRKQGFRVYRVTKKGLEKINKVKLFEEDLYFSRD